MTAPARRRKSPTQRARLQMRLARNNMRVLPSDDDDEPQNLKSAGTILTEGTAFDWTDGLYLDQRTNELMDSGDQFARDMRMMLKGYGKARTIQKVLSGPIKGATWKLEPGKGDTGEAADTEERLRRAAKAGGMSTPIGRVIGQMTSGFWAKRAYFVKSYMLDDVAEDGSVLFRGLAMRPATTCRLRVDDDGSFNGFAQDIQLYGNERAQKWDGMPVLIDPPKAFVYVHGLDEDPVGGISDLEVTFWCWRTQQKVIALWLNFLAAQALPRTMVKGSGDDAKTREAAAAIAKTGSSGVVYFDGQTISVDTLDVSGKGPGMFQEAIKYFDSMATGSVLAGFLDLSSQAADGKGSLALSSDQSDFFLQERIQASQEIAECLTNYAVADLVRFNHGRKAAMPTFQFDPLAGVDDQPVMDLLKALAPSRVTPMPDDFVDELAIEAARILHLDVDKLQKALGDAAQVAKQQALEQHAAAVYATKNAGQPVPPAKAAAGKIKGQAAAVGGAIGKVKQIAGQVAGK